MTSPLTPLYFGEPIPGDFRQGDIYRDVLHLMFSEDEAAVVRSFRNPRNGRTQVFLHGRDNPPSDGFRWAKEAVVVEGQLGWGIVLTHDCDLENDDEKSHRLVALLRPFGDLGEESQGIILRGEHMGRLYLPAWEEMGLPETYVDFRRWTTLREDALSADRRVVSMTDNGRRLLHAGLIRCLAAVERPALPAPTPTALRLIP